MSTKPSDIAPRRSAILDALREAGEALTIREIVARTDLEYNNARSALSEMTTMKLLVRVNRGIYDLPERVPEPQTTDGESTLQKILFNQQILKVLLNIVITNKALMEALLLGQQEIIRTIRNLNATTDENEETIKNLEKVFAKRVEWHFDIAAQKVVEQYTKLPPEVLNVLVAPLARDKESVSNKAKEQQDKEAVPRRKQKVR